MSTGRCKTSIWGDTAKKYIFEKYLERKNSIRISLPDTWQMKRGRELEPIAKIEYFERYGTEILEVDFIKSPCGRMIGASADGKSEGLIYEIKCRNGMAHFAYGFEAVSDSHDDFWQIQTEMYCAGVKKAKYINYNPEYYNANEPQKSLDLIVQDVEISDMHINKLLSRVDEAELHIKAMMLMTVAEAWGYINSIN
jgi:hypothetical protein